MQTLIIAGASGLVGQAALEQALANPAISSVYALVRRPLGQQHAKLKEINLGEPLPQANAMLIALGTTIAKAGSQAAFRAVDVDLVLQCAAAAKAAGVGSIGVVSSLGAAANGSTFYLRCKAEMEQGVKDLGFAKTVFIRPSFLTGARAEFRIGEKIALFFAALFRPLIPKVYKPVAASAVASSLLASLGNDAQGVVMIENAAI